MSIQLRKNKDGTVRVTASAGEDLRTLLNPPQTPEQAKEEMRRQQMQTPPESRANFEARIRADEREACAKIAEHWECPEGPECQHNSTDQCIAAAIRARGGGK